MWVVAKIMVPFRVLSIILHLIFNFRDPNGDHNFDNYPLPMSFWERYERIYGACQQHAPWLISC